MMIDGLQKMTLIDYPGKVAAIIFTFGCNFRCGFCHNPSLVHPELRQIDEEYSEENILKFLETRRGFVDALVITGGEPTLQPDLIDFILKVRAMGFLIKLDTNGTDPKMVKELIDRQLIDFWAMDIKNAPSKYAATVCRPVNIDDLQKSIELIKNSGVDYEFRTTILQSLHTQGDILELAKFIKGAKKLALQKFIPRAELVDNEYANDKSFSLEALEKIAQLCEEWVEKCEVRGF